MEPFLDEKPLLLEFQMFLNCHFCTVVIIWIIVYVIIYLAKKIYKSYVQKRKDIIQDLCKSVVENRVADCVGILEMHSKYINKYTEDGYTPFLIACSTGNTQIVKIMLKKGADIRIKSWNFETPFYLACFHYVKNPKVRDASCIRELYYAGADINESNYKGLNPLQMAAMFGHTPLVKWLLYKNASTSVIPNPYILAVTQGHEETASVLSKLGSSLAIGYK